MILIFISILITNSAWTYKIPIHNFKNNNTTISSLTFKSHPDMNLFFNNSQYDEIKELSNYLRNNLTESVLRYILNNSESNKLFVILPVILTCVSVIGIYYVIKYYQKKIKNLIKKNQTNAEADIKNISASSKNIRNFLKTNKSLKKDLIIEENFKSSSIQDFDINVKNNSVLNETNITPIFHIKSKIDDKSVIDNDIKNDTIMCEEISVFNTENSSSNESTRISKKTTNLNMLNNSFVKINSSNDINKTFNCETKSKKKTPDSVFFVVNNTPSRNKIGKKYQNMIPRNYASITRSGKK